MHSYSEINVYTDINITKYVCVCKPQLNYPSAPACYTPTSHIANDHSHQCYVIPNQLLCLITGYCMFHCQVFVVVVHICSCVFHSLASCYTVLVLHCFNEVYICMSCLKQFATIMLTIYIFYYIHISF